MDETMTTWPHSLQDGWFVVASSSQLRSKPLGILFMGRPIVLARLQTGTVTAMEDRCPHRQFPLSAGRITSEGLQCGYHGWTFDASGRCVKQPGQTFESCAPRVGVKALQTMEHDGLLWLRARAPNVEPSPALPGFIANRPQGSLRFLQRMDWKGDTLDALENFLDPMHTHLTHPGLVRKDGARRLMTASVVHDQQGLTVTYSGQEEQKGLLFRLFESPRSLERAHYSRSSPGSACLEYRYQNGSALFFTLHFTPVEAWKTRVFATLHVEGRWAPPWLVRAVAWPFLKRVAAQDQRAVELQAENRQRFGKRNDASTELDVVSAYVRSIWHEAGEPAPALLEDRRVRMMI